MQFIVMEYIIEKDQATFRLVWCQTVFSPKHEGGRHILCIFTSGLSWLLYFWLRAVECVVAESNIFSTFLFNFPTVES